MSEQIVSLDELDYQVPAQETMLKIIWRNFKRHPMALLGTSIILVIVLFSIFAFLSPYDPNEINNSNRWQTPSWQHPFGTDKNGRDILTRIAYGGRVSLVIGVLSMTTAAILGIVIGGLAGFYRGLLDNVLMRITDFFFSFPQLFVLLFLSFILRESNITFMQGGYGNIILVIGVTSWMTMARLVRATFLELRESDFTRAARSYGSSDLHIMIRHILPNAMGPIIVSSTMGTAWAILTESGLSFLGYGIQPPAASWGNMLQDARATIGVYPLQTIFPGAFIFLTVIALNYMGDALRDALDPYKFVGHMRQ
jgi:peptide/nickel transport system permease protein